MKKYIDDILVFLGIGVILVATARINLTAMLYVMGVFLIAGGIFYGMSSGKKGSQ